MAGIFGYFIGKEKNYAPRKLLLMVGILLHITVLGFFKYFYDFTAFLQYTVLHTKWKSPLFLSLQQYSLLFPIGISYYTFRALSYIFDIYLCKMRPVRHFTDLLLYISFFPQLASGPIVQAADFLHNLPASLTCDANPSTPPIELDRSVMLLLSGLYKKLILANFLSVLAVDPVFANPAQCNTIELITALVSYTFVIYCDFSGYSDMAIGLALLLGFHSSQNFNRPYISQSVSEFWRRWHISLSAWLRNYVYFSFGGSRFGLVRTVIALLATMMIAGIWHGSRFTFLLWGTLQGIACSIERIIAKKKYTSYHNTVSLQRRYTAKLTAQKALLLRGIRTTGVFCFINISWLLFKSESVQEAWLFITSLKNVAVPFQTVHSFTIVVLAAAVLLQLPGTAIRKKSFYLYIHLPVPLKAATVMLFFIGIAGISISGIAPFIYFGF